MVSIRTLLGKDDRFNALFEASAREALTSVQTLIRFLQQPGREEDLAAFTQSRRAQKTITGKINEALSTVFVTSLDREDIVLVQLLRQLYARNADTVQVVFLKNIFELLEKIADRCRDAGLVINYIVLRNS